MCGVLLQRGRAIILCCIIPITALFFQTEAILVALGQDQQVSENAQKYVLVNIPKLILFGMFDFQRRWLNCFEYNHIPLKCTSIAVVLHFFICWYFVSYSNMGILGLGIGGCCTNLISFTLLQFFSMNLPEMSLCYCSFIDKRVYDRAGLEQFLRIAAPMIVVLYMNFWILELMCLVAGMLSVTD